MACEQEVGNSHDPQAVAIKKVIDGNLQVVGHIPRKISSICSIFIRRGGKITCRITRHRRYLLKVPCILTFTTASDKECSKTKKIFESTLSVETREAQSGTSLLNIRLKS